jgi:hypothetical protein
VRKAVETITVFGDALSFHVVEDFPDLLGRELVMIQKRNEMSDGSLEVNIVFPERVVGIDEKSLGDRGEFGRARQMSIAP